MNSQVQGNNLTSESAALQLVSQVKFAGLTPLGTELRNKVLEPLVMGPARRGQLQKPVLIIIVTDGVPVRFLFYLVLISLVLIRGDFFLEVGRRESPRNRSCHHFCQSRTFQNSLRIRCDFVPTRPSWK